MSTLRPPLPEELAELTQLHRRVRYLDAFHYAQRFAPPEQWTHTEAILLAGRFFSCWGDWARSNRLHFLAYRHAPQDPRAVYFHSLSVGHKHGPFEALRFLRDHRVVFETDAPAPYQVWLSLHQARLLGTFRDFDAAEALVRRAETHAAADPWFWVERARLRQQQDRYADALADAEHALVLGPDYRPAIETVADLLILQHRDADALALLQRSVAELQAANLAQSLANLLLELERHTEALAALDRAAEFLPAADRNVRQWLAARRADTLRALGRDTEAAEQARLAKHSFHDHIAARLSEPAPPHAKRVHLRVDFVRQHHMTCAPATLAALGGYWRRPVDHLELARIICYDGTPDHEERHWAESNGWIAREFRVTWETAVTLLDRGCPFTLTTVYTRSAHLQAVVGYDSRLGLLLIRDPYQRTHGECIAETFIKSSTSHGPRGMVLVPPENAALLDGLELPDAPLYDQWYRLRRALLGHDRASAQSAADALAAASPGHRLALHAQRELAFYDGNILRQLELTRALLALFPDDANLLLDQAQLLRSAGHSRERREHVEALARRRPADPLFLREYVEMLGDDARVHPRALREARRVLRRHSVEAGNLRAFANLLWSRQQFTDATAIYRLAACVGDKIEFHWDSFFTASRHTQQVDGCLELLRQRHARLGTQSSQPVRTLFRACETLDRTPEGFAALADALTRRPDDGELQLFAAESHARFGRLDDAARLLASATGRASRATWLRTSARLAEFRAEHAAALGHWRELLQLNPLDVGAHTAAATLLSTLEGRPAALAFLRDACARHPTHIPLHHTLLEWLRSEPPEEALVVADHLLALDPANAWALREKALILRRAQRPADALTLVDEACRIEPTSPFSPAIRGVVLHALGREADARAAFEEALRLSIDCGYMDQLLGACRDFAERKAAIAFLQRELARQPVLDGGTFLKFREVARPVLTPDELRTTLENLQQISAANWGAWSALVVHLLDQRQVEPALTLARQAVERFPLVPRLWVDLAAAQSHARQPQAEIESLQRALELSPGWGHASRELAAAHERALQLDAAEHVLRRALATDPLDAASHAWLADLQWRRGRQDDAVALLERALMLEPGYDWAWQRLDQWSFERSDTARVASLAEAITRARPADARAWVRLARIQAREAAAALATVERAIAVDPRNIDAHDLRAQLLVSLNRHDDAVAACRPAAFGDAPPMELLGRAAWIEHERGDVQRAIADLRRVLDAHPDYAWGWGNLTEWYWETSQPKLTAEAATKWAWLEPHSAVPFGFLASAEQRLGHRREAKDAFWRALHCNPAYGFGAQKLLQLLAEDRELEEAARVLRHIETHLSPADAHRAAVHYHIMRRDKAAAGQALAALAFAPDAQIHFLDEAANALAEAGWRSVTEETLAPLLADPKAHRNIGRFWVAAWAPDKQWRKLRQLEQRSASEPVRRLAWAEALEQLGRARAIWRLRWHRWRRGDWLRAGSETWGAFGYALITAGQPAVVIKWCHDWRERTDLEPWMLHNLACAYYHRKKPSLALAVVDQALTLKPDHTRPGFLIWRGLENLFRGETAAAATALAQTSNAVTADYMKFERTLLEILVAFEQARAASSRTALRDAKNRLAEHWIASPIAHGDTSLVHFRARALRHLAARSGSRFTQIQSFFPPPGRKYRASPDVGFALRYWWVIWIAFLVIHSLINGL